MAGLAMKKRQAIIDGYLAATGQNTFHAGAFIDWLAGQPTHEAFGWFYGADDAKLAREHRIDMARRWASGLRITVQSSITDRSGIMSVVTREYPALVSPMANRKAGGGYVDFDVDDPLAVAELRRQGAQALLAWLNRYRGVYELGGMDLSPIELIADAIRGSEVVAA